MGTIFALILFGGTLLFCILYILILEIIDKVKMKKWEKALKTDEVLQKLYQERNKSWDDYEEAYSSHMDCKKKIDNLTSNNEYLPKALLEARLQEAERLKEEYQQLLLVSNEKDEIMKNAYEEFNNYCKEKNYKFWSND